MVDTQSSGNRKSDVKARSWLKPDQVEAMRTACLSGAFPEYLEDRNETIVAMLYDLGLRASELVSLDVGDLDLEADPPTVYLASEIQKGSPPPATLELGRYGTSSERSIRRYLRDRWKDTEALFPTRSSARMSTRSLERLIDRVAREAGVEPQLASGGTGEPSDVSPHTLRHSVAYRIIQVENERLEDVQLRLRHANRSTTDQIYSHLVPR